MCWECKFSSMLKLLVNVVTFCMVFQTLRKLNTCLVIGPWGSWIYVWWLITEAKIIVFIEEVTGKLWIAKFNGLLIFYVLFVFGLISAFNIGDQRSFLKLLVFIVSVFYSSSYQWQNCGSNSCIWEPNYLGSNPRPVVISFDFELVIFSLCLSFLIYKLGIVITPIHGIAVRIKWIEIEVICLH